MLEVERLAKAVACEGIKVVGAVPRGHGDQVDQVKRALVSTVLNTTEGLHRTAGDRRQLLTVARGSAAEAAVGLGLLAALGLVPEAASAALDTDLDRIRAMLFRLGQK